MMTPRIVILGGGTGGTLAANRLRRTYTENDLTITVVDQDDRHVYQPGLLFVPFGQMRPGELVRQRRQQLHRGIEFRQSPIDHVEVDGNQVYLADGAVLDYDLLIVATGAVIVPEETEGLIGPGVHQGTGRYSAGFVLYLVSGASPLFTLNSGSWLQGCSGALA